KLLFMPDLFNFLMTGEQVSEYSIASTSQLLNAESKKWDSDIFNRLRLPIDIMPTIVQPGSIVGKLLPEIVQDTNLSPVYVVAPVSHDTASAVAAVPATSHNWAYLSSGTWSLLGIEIHKPIINQDSLDNNFTNEGGVNQTIRFLRNTMGLWLFERCLHKWKQAGETPDYTEVISMAEKAQPFKCIVNPDDSTFLNPPDMPQAIVEFCKKTNQPYPQTKGEFARCIFESLALKYRYILEKINSMRGQAVETLHIVGGGSQNEFLNQLTANSIGIKVIAGPAEATAIGNIIVQAIAKRELNNINESRELVANSFPLKHYEPQNQEEWNEQYSKVNSMFS
ncbi:MAG: rhamnulokinase, partial [bacterium]